MGTAIDQSRIKDNGSSKTFLHAYLEGRIVRKADIRQAERIVNESNAAMNLRTYLNNNAIGDIKVDDELNRLFNKLESFVLKPIELQNSKELSEQHLAVRYRSIEVIEKVLVLVNVESEALAYDSERSLQ